MPTRVPTYALYGESTSSLLPESLHCESIPQRSRLYDWEIKPHRHEFFMQILYLRGGTADILFGDRLSRVQGPCLLYVPPGLVHGFRFSQDVDGAVMTAVGQRHLDTLAPQGQALLDRLGQAHHLPLPPDRGTTVMLAATLEQLLAEFDTHDPWRTASLDTLLRLVLIRLVRELDAASAPALDALSRAASHVQRFQSLLQQSFREERDIAHYASRLGITPTQLNRVCRAQLNQSALGVINHRLLIEAKRDLAYSSLSVKEIALTLGFSDPAYFSRFFTKQARLSPTAFRELARQRLARDAVPTAQGNARAIAS